VEAKDLKVGSLLQTEDGRVIDVDGIEKREGKFEVYNFKVEGFHTYFVSDLGILVHNAFCVNGLLSDPKSIWGDSPEDIQKAFQDAGYSAVIEPSTKGSKLSTQIKIGGHPEITNIQVHPGGGRHKGSYYKISTSTQGKVKVVDPITYVPDPKEKATIFNIE
jgi:hypothetical protein